MVDSISKLRIPAVVRCATRSAIGAHESRPDSACLHSIRPGLVRVFHATPRRAARESGLRDPQRHARTTDPSDVDERPAAAVCDVCAHGPPWWCVAEAPPRFESPRVSNGPPFLCMEAYLPGVTPGALHDTSGDFHSVTQALTDWLSCGSRLFRPVAYLLIPQPLSERMGQAGGRRRPSKD